MDILRASPPVTIIVPTYNSQKTVERCLHSIRKQTYRNIESLIVDNFSTDKTTRIAKRSKAKVLQLKGERSAAKNYAAQRAGGDFLFFVDSDMELHPNVVEECVRKCIKSDVDAVVVRESYSADGLVGSLRRHEKELLSEKGNLIELPRFFKRDVFLRLGGFDEKLVCGEDFDLSRRLNASGYKVTKVEAEIEHSEGALSLYDVAVKGYDYGKTLPGLVQKAPREIVKRYVHIRIASLQGTTTHSRSLAILLVFLLMKTVEYLGYSWGICVGMISRSFAKRKFDRLMMLVRKNGGVFLGLIFFILIALIIFRNFFLTSELPGGNDTFGWISREYIFARDYRWLYVWRPYSFGFVEGINLMDMFFMLTNFVFADAVLTIKVFLFLCFLLAGFSTYAFAYCYTHNSLAALSASLVYTLNQWFFSQLTEGHVDLVFSYAFAPLLFLLVDRVLERGGFKRIVFSALALAVFLTGFHANSVVIYGFFLALFLAIYLFFPSHETKIVHRGKNLLKFLAIGGIVAFLLTAFFTLPFFMNVRAYFMTEEYKYQIEEAEFFGAANLTEAFTLGATEEGGYLAIVDVRSGFGLPDFPVQAFLFFVFLACYSAILVRRDRYTVFFLIAAVVSAFISKATNPPVGAFFTWAWLNIPHFAVFRRPNRWEMMTAFSNAFFVALFVSLVYRYISKKPSDSQGTFLKIGLQKSKQKLVKTLNLSASLLDKWFEVFRKLSRFIGITLIVLIILSGVISSWFFFYNGLLTYKLPRSYEKPFNWIAEQPGNYKIMTVNKGPEEWADDPNAVTDFAFCRMLTDIGWVHDIGFDSSVIHDKPVLQDGGWEPASKFFVDYLRRGIAERNMTDNFLRILGSFNYRYVVLPPYGSEKMRNFILNQKGAHLVYNESGSIIVENDYVAQQVFFPRNSAIVIGGSDALVSLYKIDSFMFNETVLIFMDPKEPENVFSDESLGSSDALIFANGADILDAAIPFMKDSVVLITAKDYAVPSGNITGHWIGSSFWRDSGRLVLGGDTLTTRGPNRVEIPFSINTEGEHEIWMRIAFADDRGKLMLYLDDEFLEELSPTTDYWTTLKWVKIATQSLKSGRHFLTLRNDGSGYNDVDAICIAEKSAFKAKFDLFMDKLKSFKGRIIYALQPEDFLLKSFPRWSITSQAYEGNVLVGENTLINVSPQATANASSTQFIQTEKINASYVADGDLKSRWASAAFEDPPQWLELNWTNPQEIVAVKVSFENALAEDYAIQAWDERNSAWITEASVTGNSEFIRLHAFERPVNTTKIRIYVTKFDGFALVSIYELEAYEKSATISYSVPIWRNGNYQVFIRAQSMSENGKIYLRLGNETSDISLLNMSSGYQWFDAGVFSLNGDEREVSLGALGEVDISQILLYSLSENESSLRLSDLFPKDTSSPVVVYDRVNPCTYKLQISTDRPFLLVFSETYNPLWKASVENEEITSFPVYSFLNGFYINKTGILTVTLYFTGQSYVDEGLKVALASFAVSLVVVTIPDRVQKRIVSKIKRSGRD